VARPACEEALLKKWLVRVGQLVLTVGVTWLIVDRVGLGFHALASQDLSAWLPDPALFVAASLLLMAAYFASAWLWGLLVRDLGGPRIPAPEAVRLFMIANLGRYIPGKLWQIAGLAALAKGRGVPPATATGAAILGQGIALVAASAVGTGAILAGPEPYRRWGVVGAALVGVLLVLLSIPPVFRALARGWFRLTRTSSENEPTPAHGLRWLALYVANWVLYAFAFWVLARSLGLGGELVPVGSAFAAAYVLGYVMIFAPAGLGPREGFLIAFLTPYLGAAPSGVLAVVARLWTTVVELLPAGVFWIQHVAARPRSGPVEPAEGSGR
jgi:glycosyltransferase 2 family protein